MSDNGRTRLMVRLICSALMLLAFGIQASSASAAGLEFEFTGESFGPEGVGSSSFGAAGSVAIDQEQDLVYVLDRAESALYKYDLNGNPVDFGGATPNVTGNKLSGLLINGELGKRQVAVDSERHIIYLTGGDVLGQATTLQAFKASGEPSLFSEGPGKGTNEITGFASLRGVAVDSTGNIYASGVHPGEPSTDINIYRPSGALLQESIGGSLLRPANIAVDTRGTVYVLLSGSAVSRLTPSEYPVSSATTYSAGSEAVDPNAAVSLAVDPLTDRLYVMEGFSSEGTFVSRVAVYGPDGSVVTTFGGPGEAGELKFGDGIAIGNSEVPGVEGSVARLFAASNPVGGLAQVEIFDEKLCICKPSIELTSVNSVTGDSAVLRGVVNPNNRSTSYWFEYGLQDCEIGPCTKVPLTGGSVGRGRRGVVVTESIVGLSPQTTYHYRVVAVNEIDTTEGPDKTFTTQGSALGFALSDSRVWEMVSPAQKHGGALFASGETIIQASVSGERFVYSSRGSLVERPGSNRLPVAASMLAQREANGTWTTQDLSPPQSEASRITDTPFKIFSPDLLRGEMEATDSTPLSPEASEQTPYLWTDHDPPLFTPLVNPSNVPPGTKFGPNENTANPVRVEGASLDLDHVVIKSDLVPLVAGAEGGAVYLWSDGQLEAVSELPDGGPVVAGLLGSGPGSVRHAVSADGSLVFWATGGYQDGLGNALTGLFVRDSVAKESGRLDRKQLGGSGDGPVRPAFNGASADGTVVFFTDSQQLTADASPDGRDLYRCEIGPVEGGPGCAELSDISAPLVGSGESADVLDQVSALSEDGTRLYFVARGVLDEGQNSEGDVASPGEPNLYFWQEGQGTRFIATLSDQDALVWGSFQGGPGYAGRISAAASPDGRFFSFTSDRSLTGYENRNSSDDLNSEVFAFDSEAAADQLTCVSCNPSGAAAVGEQIPDNVKFLPQDPAQLWVDRWVSGTVPTASQTEDVSGRSLYRPRSVLDDGRVFFNAVDPLVPADSNGNWDVYQYEPVGVGSCAETTSTAAAVRSGNGCVGLLSSGTADGDAGFLEASPSGADVFFLTEGRLSVLDKDDELDAYDARVNGIEAVLNPIRECAGEACQQSIGPPNDPTPASESFRGAETPIKCRKGQRKVHRKGRTVCVRKKHKKQGKNQKKRAGNDRRAQR